MTDLRLGGCLCGAIRYRCGAPIYPPTLCHCASCRRASGAHALGWITVANATFEWMAAPRTYASSSGVERTFCGNCGTPLTYRHSQRAGETDITIGSLDAPGEVVPVDHLWMDDAVAWDRPSDGLPQHRRTRAS